MRRQRYLGFKATLHNFLPIKQNKIKNIYFFADIVDEIYTYTLNKQTQVFAMSGSSLLKYDLYTSWVRGRHYVVSMVTGFDLYPDPFPDNTRQRIRSLVKQFIWSILF